MTFEPHFRLTMQGDLPDGEMFSCSLSLVPDDSVWQELVLQALKVDRLISDLAEASGGELDDIVADVTGFWSAANAHISADAVLKRVKLAAVDEDGHYVSSPREAAVNVAGADGGSTYFPHQMARKITLETDADLGRVKGGFYLPGTTATGFDHTTNLYSAENSSTLRDTVKDLIDNLNNAPGLDAHALRVVIASQGRHNPDGSVRLAPGNHDVVRVNVGRRIDVQRRRANKISEARITDAAIA